MELKCPQNLSTLPYRAGYFKGLPLHGKKVWELKTHLEISVFACVSNNFHITINQQIDNMRSGKPLDCYTAVV